MAKRGFVIALGAASVAVMLGGIALAPVVKASDPVTERKEDMKKVGGAAKLLGGMMKGDVAYDAAKAAEAATTIADVAKEFPEYFPTAPAEGEDTSASPKIWETMDDFKAKSAALATDAAALATAAAAATSADDAFKAAAGKMFGHCKDCHEAYRVKKG
ncbi:MAG: cytochrome c [Hyphomicrobiaceae bacterium]